MRRRWQRDDDFDDERPAVAGTLGRILLTTLPLTLTVLLLAIAVLVGLALLLNWLVGISLGDEA